MKIIRFSQVVARSGRPQVHSLWVDPARDRVLRSAEKAHRVMTIAPAERGKADVGTVGFDRGRSSGAQILIFPKSLQRFAGTRVVGVKFDLVEQPSTRPARIEDTLAATGRRPQPPRHRASRASATSITTSAPGATHPARTVIPKPAAIEKTAKPPRSPRRQSGRPSARSRRTQPAKTGDDSGTLKNTIRAALAELSDGKTVAAYQRLEKALE